MTSQYPTPQDAEDAYYDAIDEKDLSAMMSVWEESEQILCLLPMMPLLQGRANIRQAWKPMLGGELQLEMEVKHLEWIEGDKLAIHLVEEHVKVPGQPQTQIVYATNVYRRSEDGWRILMHQNAPTPPPDLRMPGE
jgi:uncharacterized protein (TIGR02246 family)